MNAHTLTLRGVNYRCLHAGSGDPLVLLHGFTGSADNWHETIAHFAPSRRVIAPDLIGHGKTDSPADASRYTFDHAADDMCALLDALSLRKVDLLGYSMGGRLAMFYALKYPDTLRSLIIESADPGIARDDERALRRAAESSWAAMIREKGIPAFVEFWENHPIFATQKRLPRAIQDHVRAQRSRNNPIGLAHAAIGLGVGAQPSLWNRLPELHMPLLYIAGELDTKFSQIGQRIQAVRPETRLNIVAESGHTVHVEQPDHFLHAVHQFLNALAG
jgi:2-succinyl-6-hydroxy-2,4-cyclohexadiene-1-carboxylate synthase